MPKFTTLSDAKCCGTCRFAKWDLTDKGNFRRDAASRCWYEAESIPKPAVPFAFEVIIRERTYVQPNDGLLCPCYEKFTSNDSGLKQ